MQNSGNSVNPNMKFTPNANVVVHPPRRVYKYSMYDELKLGENKYQQIVDAVKKPSPSNQRLKTENTLKNILGVALLAGISILGYKNRNWIVSQFKKIPEIFRGK